MKEQFTTKYLRLNDYTFCDEEVPEGTEFGFWRVVEHTGAGWFPLPSLYSSKEEAKKACEFWNAKYKVHIKPITMEYIARINQSELS
jgi:hypothetical protein